jgi:hypothetical protein
MIQCPGRVVRIWKRAYEIRTRPHDREPQLGLRDARAVSGP